MGCFSDSKTGITYGRDGFLGHFTEEKNYCANANGEKVDSCSGAGCNIVNFGCRDMSVSDALAYYGRDPITFLSNYIDSRPSSKDFYITEQLFSSGNCKDGFDTQPENLDEYLNLIGKSTDDLNKFNVECFFDNSALPQDCFFDAYPTFNDEYHCKADENHLGGKICTIPNFFSSYSAENIESYGAESHFANDILSVGSTCGAPLDIDFLNDTIVYVFDCTKSSVSTERTSVVAFQYFDENGNLLNEPIPHNAELTFINSGTFFVCSGNSCSGLKTVNSLIRGNLSCFTYPDLEGYYGSEYLKILTYSGGLFSTTSLELPDGTYCSKDGKFEPVKKEGEYCDETTLCEQSYECLSNKCFYYRSSRAIAANYGEFVKDFWKFMFPNQEQ